MKTTTKADPYATKQQKRVDLLLFLFIVFIIALVLRTSAHGATLFSDAASQTRQPFWSTLAVFTSHSGSERGAQYQSQHSVSTNESALAPLGGSFASSDPNFTPLLIEEARKPHHVVAAAEEPASSAKSSSEPSVLRFNGGSGGISGFGSALSQETAGAPGSNPGQLIAGSDARDGTTKVSSAIDASPRYAGEEIRSAVAAGPRYAGEAGATSSSQAGVANPTSSSSFHAGSAPVASAFSASSVSGTFGLKLAQHSTPNAIRIGAPNQIAGQTWTGGGGGSFLWSNANNWGGSAPNYGTISFSGSTGTTNVLDGNFTSGGNTSMNQVNWNGSSAWTMNNSGGATLSLFDNSGTQAKLESLGTGGVTINAPITFAATAGNNWGEINAVSSSITFGTGTLTVNGSGVAGIRLFGGSGAIATIFNNTVNASGKYFATSATNQTINIGGAFSSGDFYLMNGGTLKMTNATATFTTSGTTALRLGGDFGTTGTQNQTLGATFQLTPLAGGVTVNALINTVGGNTSGALLIDSLNTSGLNNLANDFYLDADLKVQQAAGGTLQISDTTLDLKNQTMTVLGNGIVSLTGVVGNSTGSGKLVLGVDGTASTGTLKLSSTNTYTGDTTIRAGTLDFATATASSNSSTIRIGSTTGSAVAANINLSLLAGGLTVASTINPVTTSGSGLITVNSKNTSGTNTLSGHIGMDRDMTITESGAAGTGVLAITQARAGGVGTTTGTDIKSFTLTLDVTNTGNSMNFSGDIYSSTGSGVVTKTGSGSLTLSGTNTYTGNTNISAGTLRVAAANALGATTDTINLGSTGSATTATLEALNSNLTLAAYTLNVTSGGAAANRVITANGYTANLLALTNVNTVLAGDVTFNVTNSTVNGNAMRVGNITGSGNVVFNLNGTTNATNATNIILQNATTFTGGVTVTGNTAGNLGVLNLNTSTSLRAANSVTLDTGGRFNINDQAPIIAGLISSSAGLGTVFNSSASLRTLTIGGTTATAYDYSGKLTATTLANLKLAIALTGGGSQTLSGSTNDYAGGTDVNNGTLIIGNKSALGTGAITFNSTTAGSAAVLQANTALTGANAVANALSVANTQGIATIGGASNLEFSGVTTFSSGGSRTLTINNSGTNTFSNATVFLTDTDTSGRTATIGGTGSATISGVLANNAAGGTTNSTALTYSGSGTLSLNNANTYTGLTTISSGTIKLGNATGLGTTAGGTTVSSGGTLDLNGQTSVLEVLTLNGTGVGANGALVNSNTSTAATVTSESASNNSNSFTVGGAGDITLQRTRMATSGSNNVLTKIGAGTLTLGNSSATGANNNLALIVNSASTVNLGMTGANIAVDRGLTINAGGTVKFTGNSAGMLGTNNAITVSNGTLDLNGVSSNVGTGVLTVGDGTNNGIIIGGSGSTFTSSSSYDVRSGSVDVKLAGAGTALTKTTSGTVTLSQANTYTGATLIGNGTLALSAASTNNIASSSGITLANGTTLDVSGLTSNQIALASGQTLTGTGATGAVTGAGGVKLLGNNAIGNNAGGTLTTSGIIVNSTGNSIIAGGTISGNITQVASSALAINGTATGSDALANLATLSGTGLVGAVTLAGNNTVSSTGILATGGITVSGTGNTIGTGTVTGAITQNASSALNVTGAAGSDALANLATLSGTGSVGTVTLAGNNTLSSNGTLATGGITVNGSGNLLSSGTVSGNITQNASSALTVNGTASGSDSLASGASLAGSGIITGAISLAGNDTLSSSGTLTGSGTLTVSGTGNSISSGIVSIAGLTTINSSAAFKVNGGATLSGLGAVSVSGTLSGTGTVSKLVTINSGGHLAPGNSVGTLNLASLTLSNGSILDYDFNTTPANDFTNVTTSGGLTLNGGGFNLYDEGTTNTYSTNGLYNLIGYSGTLNGSFSNLSVLNQVFGKSYTFGATGSNITLTIGTNAALAAAYWRGAIDSTWNSTSGTQSNFTTDLAGTINANQLVGATTDVFFTATNGTQVTTSLGQNFTINSLTFNNSATSASNVSGNTLTLNAGSGNGITVDSGSGAHTISSNVALGATQTWTNNSASSLTLSGVVSGSGFGLTTAGTGTIVFSGAAANTYSGLTTVSAGELDLNKTSAIAVAGNLTVAGGTAKLLASNQIATSSNVTVSGGTLALQGFDNTVAGVQLSSGAITGSGGTLTSASNFDVRSGSVSAKLGGSVGLDKTTGGTVILSGANTYTGTTAISAGTLTASGGSAIGDSGAVTLANAAGATFNLISSETIGSLAGGGATGGNVTLNGNQLTTGGNNASTALGGVISGSGGSLVKSGTGTFTLNAANTFTGATTVAGGALQADAASALGGTSGITVNSGGTLLISNNASTNHVNNAATVAEAGGTLKISTGVREGTATTVTGGVNNGGTSLAGLGALTLSSASFLDFDSAGASTLLAFTSFTPSGNVLSISGYTNLTFDGTLNSGALTDDRLVFATSQSANFAFFDFGGGAGVGVTQIALDNGFYEVGAFTAVPEPSTWMAGILALLAVGYSQRRRFRALVVARVTA